MVSSSTADPIPYCPDMDQFSQEEACRFQAILVGSGQPMTANTDTIRGMICAVTLVEGPARRHQEE
jgi:hypothetical protein